MSKIPLAHDRGAGKEQQADIGHILHPRKDTLKCRGCQRCRVVMYLIHSCHKYRKSGRTADQERIHERFHDSVEPLSGRVIHLRGRVKDCRDIDPCHDRRDVLCHLDKTFESSAYDQAHDHRHDDRCQDHRRMELFLPP